MRDVASCIANRVWRLSILSHRTFSRGLTRLIFGSLRSGCPDAGSVNAAASANGFHPALRFEHFADEAARGARDRCGVQDLRNTALSDQAATINHTHNGREPQVPVHCRDRLERWTSAAGPSTVQRVRLNLLHGTHSFLMSWRAIRDVTRRVPRGLSISLQKMRADVAEARIVREARR